jgi:hypothetical protein
MLPQEHALLSLFVALLYSSFAFSSSKESLLSRMKEKIVSTRFVVFIITGMSAGVLIDVDHLLWGLALNPSLTLQLVFTFNISGLYAEFLTSSGYFHSYMVNYLNLLILIHGLWIFLISIISFVLLPRTRLGYCRNMIVLVLLAHYISDFTWFFR